MAKRTAASPDLEQAPIGLAGAEPGSLPTDQPEAEAKEPASQPKEPAAKPTDQPEAEAKEPAPQTTEPAAKPKRKPRRSKRRCQSCEPTEPLGVPRRYHDIDPSSGTIVEYEKQLLSCADCGRRAWKRTQITGLVETEAAAPAE